MQHVHFLASSWCRVCLPGGFQVGPSVIRILSWKKIIPRRRILKFISTTDSLKKSIVKTFLGLFGNECRHR